MTEKKNDTQDSALEKELEEITQTTEKKLVERIDADKLSLNGAKYEIITNHKEAIDLEMLEARYSELLEKYDYIVGDISYDKLRLRGFYEDNAKKVPIDMRISSLDDYLLEYCSFGCKHFVLKRLDPPKKMPTESEPHSKRPQRKKTRRPSRKPNPKQEKPQSKKQPRSAKPSSDSKKPAKRDFVQKEVRQSEPKEKKTANVQTVKDKKGNTRFQIHRKKTEANK